MKIYINVKIITIRNSFHKNSIFFFKEIGKIEVIKEIKYPDIGLLTSDIPVKIIKESDDLFAIFITEKFNLCLNKREFIEILETPGVSPIYKKAKAFAKDQLAFYLIFQKSMNELCIIE